MLLSSVIQMLTCIRQVDFPHQYYIFCPYHSQKGASTVRVKRLPSVRNEEQGNGYLMRKWVLEKLQQVEGKMNRLQKTLKKFQQAMDKINRV